MKKYIFLVVTILIIASSVGCTITIPAPEVQTQRNNNEIPASQDSVQNQSNNTSAQANTNKEAQTTPTPEPTQQFVDDSNQATIPSYVDHSDIMGTWYAVVWDDINIDKDLIFYEITSSMMNVLPYGSAPKNSDYNYSYSNGVIDLGIAYYDVILDQGVLVLTAHGTGKMIVFQPVTQQEIQTIVASSSSSSNGQQFVDGSQPSGPFDVVAPSSPSGRTGYPHNQGEIVDKFTGSAQVDSQITGRTWRTYGYAWSDGTIVHDFMGYAEFNFYNDYTFSLAHSFGTNIGLYELAENAMILYYSDGTQDFYSDIFIEVNQNTGYAYLFISDEDEGYEGCYKIYEGY